jgi:hypothetical protein
LKEYLAEQEIRQVPWIQSFVFFSNDEAYVRIDGTDSKKCPILQGKQALLDYFSFQEQAEQSPTNSAVMKKIITELKYN